ASQLARPRSVHCASMKGSSRGSCDLDWACSTWRSARCLNEGQLPRELRQGLNFTRPDLRQRGPSRRVRSDAASEGAQRGLLAYVVASDLGKLDAMGPREIAA